MPDNPWWLWPLALLLGGLAGYVIGHHRAVRAAAEAAAAATRADEIARQMHFADEERRKLLAQVQAFAADLAAERQKTAGIEEARATLKAEIENLAASILEDKSKRFTEQNRAQLEQLLGPLGERIREFRQQVSDAYGRENEGRAALAEQVRMLHDLNQSVSQEARNLASALKGQAKTRGNWGELVLETVLERAGLARGTEFLTQQSFTTADGRRLQPDVVINLTDGRQLVVDAKVSLVAYERLCSAQTDEERAAAAREHAEAVRRHIEQLADKDYAGLPGLNTAGFVLLFVPIEPALHAALEAAPDLLEAALRRNIVLVTAPSLVATARLVAHLWQQEKQSRFAREIAEHSGRLYDKFANFCRDLEAIGQRLRQTQESYDAAMNKLSSGKGNLVRQAETLRKLGAKTTAPPPALLTDANDDA